MSRFSRPVRSVGLTVSSLGAGAGIGGVVSVDVGFAIANGDGSGFFISGCGAFGTGIRAVEKGVPYIFSIFSVSCLSATLFCSARKSWAFCSFFASPALAASVFGTSVFGTSIFVTSVFVTSVFTITVFGMHGVDRLWSQAWRFA